MILLLVPDPIVGVMWQHRVEPWPSCQNCQHNRLSESSISNIEQENSLRPQCVKCLEKLGQSEESQIFIELMTH